MAAGDATAADVPGKYDVVINGKGYVFADSVEPSLPFRTHRAIYDITQTFVERQNVSASYGDQSQDFFLTSTQNDWSEGEDQRFYRITDGDSKRRYWLGSRVDITVPGQVTLRPARSAINFAAAVSGCGGGLVGTGIFAASLSNLYEVSTTGAITDRGAHGAGGLPTSIVTDGTFVYISGNACTSVRKYDTSAHTFAAFSATAADSLCFLNNTLYGTRSGVLNQYDTAGAASAIFTWKNAVGTALGNTKRIIPYGGKIAVLTPANQNTSGAELWIADSTGPTLVAHFPETFTDSSIIEANGIIFVIGTEVNASKGARTVIYYYANGSIGRLWASQNWYTGTYGQLDFCRYLGGIVFPDIANAVFRYYDLTSGGTSAIGDYTNVSAATYMASSGTTFIVTRNSISADFYPSNAAIVGSGSIKTSLMDFDSSLTKVFRGITVDFTLASDGDGGSVDVSYQIDNVDGSYTSLATGVSSGVETSFGSNVTGRAITVQVTLNKGTSTLGPTLKRVYVRAAPQLKQFKSGTYIIDCTGSPDSPRQLRDGSMHPLTGYDQAQNLLTAARSTTPFSVTDKVNGTYTALVDLSDNEGWDVYEVHPNVDNKEKPGSYIVRVKLREV